MATSDHNRNNNNVRLSEDEETVKPRRKSCSKANEMNKKKVARRGMGVEKLERLINNNKTTTTTPSLVPYTFIPITTSFADPAVPLPPLSKIGGMMTGVHGHGGGGFPHQLFVHKMGINGARAFYTNGQVCDEKFQGVIDHNVKGNSKELPSIPNLMQCDYCSDCFKKKRGVRVTGNEMVFDGVNPSFFQDSVLQGAKVVAVHKKASSKIGQGNDDVVMEYEFFPGGKSAQINYSQAASPIAMGMGMGASSSCIDLSLKLSY